MLRDGLDGREVLAFRHPFAGVQVPKGTVEPGEPLADAVLRELHEESGIALDARPLSIGTWDRKFGPLEVHRWHLFALPAPAGLPDSWTHIATGSVEEEGLAFAFRWLPVDEALAGALDPLFSACAGALLSHLAQA